MTGATFTAEGYTVELADAGTTDGEWVHLLPLGRIKARDGRNFAITQPDHIIAALRKGGIDLPIDYNHGADRQASSPEPVPAAGWIHALERRKDGIWGRVRWTERARNLIQAREYRFLSPSFTVNRRTGHVGALRGAGLVHHPALDLTALAEENTMPEDDMTEDRMMIRRVAEALGLDQDATLDEMLAAIETMRTSQTASLNEHIPANVVAEMLREHSQERAEIMEVQLTAKVDNAIAGGHLTPAMRDWAVELCRSDMASFDTFLANAAPPYAHLFERKIPIVPPPSPAAEVDDDISRIARNIGVTRDDLMDG